MKRSIILRLSFVIALLIFAAYSLLPTYKWFKLPESKRETVHAYYNMSKEARTNYSEQEVRSIQSLRSNLEDKAIKLGLDLQGGMHVVLQADFEEIKLREGKELTDKEKKNYMNQAMEIIRNRVDEFGVSEPIIQRQGDDKIAVELAGIRDTDRAKSLIKNTGKLYLRLLDMKNLKLLSDKLFDKNGDLKPGAEKLIPPDDQLVYFYKKNKQGELIKQKPPFLVKTNSATTIKGEDLETAYVGRGRMGEFEVNFKLKTEAAVKFAEITGANVGEYMAIIIDNKIRSYPRIQTKISGGSVSITSGSKGFKLTEAQDLSFILRSGAIPVPLKIIEERTVGATLGKDSIDRGVKAAFLGAIFVIIFMLIYYKVAGLVADFALFICVFFILATLSFFKFTLTLPGIAGIVLTIGMAVDANVIIFERMKEEFRKNLKAGTGYIKRARTLSEAVKEGYNKAFSAILDSNVTTLISAFILAQFGTGPIKGFAVTLFIGVSASMFTALFITRLIFDILTYNDKLSKIWM